MLPTTREFSIHDQTKETDHIFEWAYIPLWENPGPLHLLSELAREEIWTYPGEEHLSILNKGITPKG